MKCLRFLSVLLALGLALGLGAVTVSVGTATGSSNHFPIHTGYSYNYTQQIYTQSQINHAGEISRIRFYHHSSYPGSLGNSHDWVIYMGHTSRSSFGTTSDWEPAANLVQVFSGSVLSSIPPPGDWLEIILDTPFNYDNFSNLVVAIHETTPGLNYSVYWGGFTSGSNTGLSLHHNGINPDINNLPEARLLTDNIAALQLVFPDTEAPLPPTLLSPADNAPVRDGQALEWRLPAGSADASGYDVYIDGVMVSEAQTARSYVLSGLETGPHTWQVIARNNVGSSLPSETRSFVMSLAIGSGDGNFQLPISLYNTYSQSQSIYLQSEIAPGIQEAQSIERIAYHWNGLTACSNSNHWIIYMGHTDRTEFDNLDAAWIPISQMVQVFDGHLALPAIPGWIEIDLDVPFVYNNADNLVIGVYEVSSGYEEGHTARFFYNTATPGQNRSIRYFEYNYQPGENPPSLGILEAAYPNLLIWFAQPPDAPALNLSPSSLDFGIVANGSSAGPLSVRAVNAGAGILNLSESDISIIGLNAAEFTFDPANLPASLGNGQCVFIPVSMTGTSSGEISATLRIVYEGQNHDVELLAEVLPTGTITIGSGGNTQVHPFHLDYDMQGSAALYTADQINTGGSIHLLAWDCAGTSNYPVPYKIWAKNTTADTMTSMRWQDMMADMTLLKQGSFTPNTLGWQAFQLDTPFAYTGGNIIIAVETTYGNYLGHNAHAFRCSSVEQRHQHWDGPSGLGRLINAVPNIMMHFSTGLQNDLGALSITGNPSPALGEVSHYTVSIRNNGSNPQSNYQVKLMGPHNTELPTVSGPPIDGFQTLEVAIPWTPASLGPAAIFGKVLLWGDELAQNDQTGLLKLEVQPAGTQAVTIGAGDELAVYPIAFDGQNSIYQTIYLADELGFESGVINSLVLYNRFAFNRPNTPAKIYMGSTDLADLSAGFIPASQLTPVFDGLIDYPTGENNIYIHFQTPYVHPGGNLVVMFHRPMEESLFWGDFFKCQTLGSNRARYANEDYELHPSNPPAGTPTGQFPRATFLHHPGEIVNDLSASRLTGSATATLGIVSPYTIRIRNHGTAAQSNYTVKIMGPHEMELASLPGPPIDAMQTLEVVIPWTPATAGPFTIYGKVELPGDEVAQNNQTASMPVYVYPEDTQSVTIGSGDQLSLLPLNYSRKQSLYQTLYKEIELGFRCGTITALTLYNSFDEHLHHRPLKIFLGSTKQNDMSAGYIPASELTLVFDGFIDYPAGENSILINLQTPYVYQGDNLIVMFHRPFDRYYYSYTQFFKSQSGGRNRAFYADFDLDHNPQGPSDGELTALYPRIAFHFNAEPIQNDLAAWEVSGNRTPTLGMTTHYKVRIRNMGIEAQTNYTVKIMAPGDITLGSVAGPRIDGLQTLEVAIPWTPTSVGNHIVYGKIEMEGDEHPTNNRTPNFDIMVQPADVHAITIGDGCEDAWYPVDIHWECSLSQTLYYPDELEGLAGYIHGIRYYSDFSSNIRDMPISIWMGTTTQADLSDGFIPSTQLTPVFAGPVNFPSGQNIVEFTFDQPFMYVDGSNLVVMVYKATEQTWYSTNLFKCQAQGSNRSVNMSSPFITDPGCPEPGTVSGYFPQTTFVVSSHKLGQLSGTVTTADGQALSNADVSINDGLFCTTTNDAGEYLFPHILIMPGAYTLFVSAYGYHDHTQSFELQADEQLTIDVSLQPRPLVNVSGTILASDTLAAISAAIIRLEGYGSHVTNTDEQGLFSLEVYGVHTYDYEISAPGYTSKTGKLDLGETDCDLGEIILPEPTHAPVNVVARLIEDDSLVNIHWSAPTREARHTAEDIEDKIDVADVRKAAARPQTSDAGSLSRSEPGSLFVPLRSPESKNPKAFIGYMVYRLQVNQEHFPGAWTVLTPEPILGLNFRDTDWHALPTGYYRWAVRCIYTNGVISDPSFSNHLERFVPCGTIAGTVRSKKGEAIFAATITNDTIDTTTNRMGAYAFTLPTGTYNLTVSAPGYISQTVEDVTVDQDLITILHFVLLTERDDDGGEHIPVAATALHGNYPNPFNPTTTISYSIKEEGRVKLEVYNIKGQKVRTLADDDHATGHYKLTFNAKDDQGRSVSSGVYLLRMIAPGYRKTAKMMLMQ